MWGWGYEESFSDYTVLNGWNPYLPTYVPASRSLISSSRHVPTVFQVGVTLMACHGCRSYRGVCVERNGLFWKKKFRNEIWKVSEWVSERERERERERDSVYVKVCVWERAKGFDWTHLTPERNKMSLQKVNRVVCLSVSDWLKTQNTKK